MDRAARARASLAVIAGLGLGCGSPVSLDSPRDEPTGSSSEGTAAASSGTADASTSGEPSSGTAAPDLPPSSEVCDPGCAPRLVEQWHWRGPEEPGPKHGSARLLALENDENGKVFLGEDRGGQAWITSMHDTGEILWSVPLNLYCDCELRSLDWSWGSVSFSGQGYYEGGYPVISLGRFAAIDGTDQQVNWIGITEIDGHPTRVGEVLAVDPSYSAVMLASPSYVGGLPGAESVELYLFDYFGDVFDGRTLDTQMLLDGVHAPVGTVVFGDAMVVAYPSFTGAEVRGYALWLGWDYLDPLDALELPGIPDAAVTTGYGRVIFASHRVLSSSEVEVFFTQAPMDLPVEWETSVVLDTVEEPQVRLLLDGSSGFTAAVPRLPAGGSQRAVEVLRYSAEGELLLQQEVPLPAEADDQPVHLARGERGEVVLGFTVHGHAELQMLDEECVCE